MAVKTFAGMEIEVNDEGYFLKHDNWNEDMAKEIAGEIDIDLSDEHMKIIYFLRSDFELKGSLPTIRRIKKVGLIPTKDLYRLFPEGPLKKACKIAGLSKPASCI